MMKKIDNYILAALTGYTLKWIKKNKYVYHKYDLFIKISTLETAWWIFATMFQAYRAIVKGIWVSSILMGILLITIIFFELMKLRDLKEMKDEYDWMWEMRKDPNVYKFVKEMCEVLFEESRKRRMFTTKVNIVLLVLMAYFNPILTPVYVFITLSSYQNHVFDFDEPPKKEKKEKDSVTNIVMNMWKQLTQGLNPT